MYSGKVSKSMVGLIDVYYKNNDGISVESAIVKYADKTKSELTELVLDGEIVSRHTNPAGCLQQMYRLISLSVQPCLRV